MPLSTNLSTAKDCHPSMLERYSSNHERDVILQALESVTFPESSRRNVRQAHDVRPNRAMCLGMTQCYFKGPMPSRCTREYPNLARLLCAWARRELPSFEFTSIQVNKDCAAALHVDSNDAGSSYIIGLGKYVGGQLGLETVHLWAALLICEAGGATWTEICPIEFYLSEVVATRWSSSPE